MKHEDVAQPAKSLCVLEFKHTHWRRHSSPETDTRVSFFTIRGHDERTKFSFLFFSFLSIFRVSFPFSFFSFFSFNLVHEECRNFSAIPFPRSYSDVRRNKGRRDTLCVFSSTSRVEASFSGQLINQEERGPITEAGLTGALETLSRSRSRDSNNRLKQQV